MEKLRLFYALELPVKHFAHKMPREGDCPQGTHKFHTLRHCIDISQEGPGQYQLLSGAYLCKECGWLQLAANLTEQQITFCEAYVESFKYDKAAIAAGLDPATAREVATEWLKQPEVREKIEILKAKLLCELNLKPIGSLERVPRSIDDLTITEYRER